MLTKQDIATPAVLVDLDKFERNLARMAHEVRASGKKLRPHFKAHKCAEITRCQMAGGAVGACVATVNEAELLSSAGIPGLLLTSPIADPLKIARIAATGAMAVVDHVRQVQWYREMASISGRVIDLLVDIDVGDHRTGARDIAQALEIGEAIARTPHLRLRGIQSYAVNGSHGTGFEDRQNISRDVFAHAAETRDAFKRKGLSTEILTGGSTGTWNIDTKLPELTEMQAGSYALMDLAYKRVGVDFENALSVLGTVVSANHEDFVTVDAGFKAFSTDRGWGPEAVDLPGSGHRWGGDEFSYVDIKDCARKPKLGDKLEFLPPHVDPTMNLYDRLYAYRGEKVEVIWPLKRLAI